MATPHPTKQLPPRLGHCEFLEVDELELDTTGLHVHPVNPVAKRRLLSPQPSRDCHASHEDDAIPLLADLNRLAPSVAKDFLSRSSIRDDVAFRLINDVHFEGAEESYVALSYVWHKIKRDTPKTLISPVGDLPFGWVQTVEQFPLPTTKGMFQAVLNERQMNEGLWFDQVCVNQEDETEKAISISNMDVIYRNARIVVVALDDVSATLDEIQFLEQYNQQYVFSDLPPNQHPNRGVNPPTMQQYPYLRLFVERVLSSMWFERAWCVHEMRMGREHIFLVPCEVELGDDSTYTVVRFTDAFFVHLLVLLSEVASSPATQQQIRSILEHFTNSYLRHKQQALARRSPNRQPYISLSQSFVPTIADVFNLKAGGNPRFPEHLRRLDANRDKTSIALNLSNIPLALKPPSPLERPAIEDECLRRLLLVGIALRDAVTLCTTGAPLQLHDGSISWLCKPTPLDIPSAYLTSPPAFLQTANPITQGSDGRAEYVQLDLIFLDLPHRTHPNPNFTVNVQRAREVIDLCIQYQVQSHTLWNLWQIPNHPRGPAMRNIFIQTLACIFECGAQFLLDAVQQPFFPQSGQTLDPQAVDMLFNPQLVVHSYANFQFFAPLLSVVATFIAHGIPWASSASEQTHGPLIISTPPPSSSTSITSSSAYAPYMGGTGKALLFAPFAHSKTLLVAMPAAIRHPEYAGLARGWILTSSNPYIGSPRGTVSWVLRGKSAIFGEGAFNAKVGESEQAAMRHHRVYGPS
ncbi:hypothetical protein BU23DRAFT_512949, partial [Bimuria novae-zelandiae CBS 107.79]